VVVAVGDEHHGAAGGARGLGVVARVAHHERARGRAQQRFAGFAQRQRIGLFGGKAVAAEHLRKVRRKPLGMQQRARKGQRLVRQARQAQARGMQRLHALQRTGVELRVLAVDGRIVPLVAGPGTRVQGLHLRIDFRS